MASFLFYHGLDPMSVAEIGARLRLPAGVVQEFMVMFAETKLVLPLAAEGTYVLARDPETIGIKDILDCVRNAGKAVRVEGERGKEENAIDELLADVDQSAGKALERKDLQTLILSVSPPERRR
jgi:DNA-binding IscR family transcriptional regulator